MSGIQALLATGPTVSSPAVALTITGTYCACTQRDGQEELAWVAG